MKDEKEKPSKEGKKKDGLSFSAPQEFDKRKESFYQTLVQYLPEYGKEMVRNFFDYWSEPTQSSKSPKKMRYEREKTWDTKMRLRTWQRREKQINGYGTDRQDNSTAEARAADAARLVARLAAEDDARQ